MTDPSHPALVGESLAIRRMRALIAKVAPTDLPVLIQGPTGSGKELVAQALHYESKRRGRFVPFNVCAISETMFEDIVFGHVRGAFTGATTDSIGYLAEADKGTVLLDEIGALTLPLQPKLLRAIETREFRPVGGRLDRRSEFRVVASTNEDLMRMVDAGAFRSDLAYRLAGAVIQVPPLRDRIEDVPLLARHFAAAMSGTAGVSVHLASDAMDTLIDHSWPGNVRELRRVVEATVVLGERETIGRGEVLEALGQVNRSSGDPARNGFPRQRLLAILKQAGWDTAAAARLLGVHRVTVYRRMRQLGVTLPARIERDLSASVPLGMRPPSADAQGSGTHSNV
jgi:two-component system response regulator AtoC